LAVFQKAIASLPQLKIQVIAITQRLLEAATLASQQFELLTGDALVAAAMQVLRLTNLASNDADFDRIPWLTRYEPV
jgi:predicted nucleic acid-binding protein